MSDNERLRLIYRRLEWDGYGYWFPERCVKVSGSFEDGDTPVPPTFEEFLQWLDGGMSKAVNE